MSISKFNSFNESDYNSDNDVFIEPVASCSDFYIKLIDKNQDLLGFDSDDFHDNFSMTHLFDEGNISSRFSIDWVNQVLSSDGKIYGTDYSKVKKYYKAIKLLLDKYNLKTIRLNADF